jgi:hypothetical protein
VLAAIAAIVMLAGMSCSQPGPKPRAPEGPLESVEAIGIGIEKADTMLVRLTCTQYEQGECVEANKPVDSDEALEIHDKLLDMDNALMVATTIGSGQTGECFGAERSADECLLAVNAALQNLILYLSTMESKSP